VHGGATNPLVSGRFQDVPPGFLSFYIELKNVVPLADGRPPVRDARRQHIKVVSLDWLEDSLLSSSRRPKPEKEYEVGSEQLSYGASLNWISGTLSAKKNVKRSKLLKPATTTPSRRQVCYIVPGGPPFLKLTRD
jgi:hypothetical protein